jgi:GNAT superfamily N-acetyltransferase
MKFALTDALLDDIIFSMESQFGERYLDTKKGCVVNAENEPEPDEFDADETGTGYDDDKCTKIEKDSERFIDLPSWDSADGFALMEHFAAGLRNTVAQKKLTAALNRGKGVFRAFKDALSEQPEVEKLWFEYKDTEMRKVVRTWSAGLGEEWAVSRLGPLNDRVRPDETGELVAEDFHFREPEELGAAGEADKAAALRLHEYCVEEHRRLVGEIDSTDIPYSNTPGGWDYPGAAALVAETAAGDFAGYVAAIPAGRNMHIRLLQVKPEYRGLGVGEGLFRHLLEKLARDNAAWNASLEITMDLPAEAEGFASVLEKEGFAVRSTRWSRSL